MKKKMRQVVQVGLEDWSKQFDLPEQLIWHWVAPDDLNDFIASLEKKTTEPTYDALFITDSQLGPEVVELGRWFDVYRVFYPDGFAQEVLPDYLQTFLEEKMAFCVDCKDPQALLENFAKQLFVGQYGAKMSLEHLAISKNFTGERAFEGHRFVKLSGNFHSHYQPVASFRYNIPIDEDKNLKLWLEYQASEGVDLRLHVTLFPSGSTEDIVDEWRFEGEELDHQLEISSPLDGALAVTIEARGFGDLRLSHLHYRFSRGDWGDFLLGGQRLVDAKREEIMTYFDPGDFKPPLNVYFSGYRTAEGFEGYFMMKKMGAPFLLITDPRLEGGAFYLGSEELETAIKQQIKDSLAFLGFSSDQLIMSGLSMGTYGALYYGAQLKPHAIIAGKPLVNLGDVAKREKQHRPSGFATSLDLLQAFDEGQDQAAIERFNQHFWQVYQDSQLQGVTLALAYMKDDDYDNQAFNQLIATSQASQTKIIGKGWIGRHNDNSPAINQWFLSQYYRLMESSFERSVGGKED